MRKIILADYLAEITVVARKAGNTVRIIFPKDIVQKEKIKPNDELILNIKKVYHG